MKLADYRPYALRMNGDAISSRMDNEIIVRVILHTGNTLAAHIVSDDSCCKRIQCDIDGVQLEKVAAYLQRKSIIQKTNRDVFAAFQFYLV